MNPAVPEEPAGEEVVPVRQVVLDASLPQADEPSKVTVATTGKLAWSEGDAFAIYDTDGNKVKMLLSLGAGTAKGVFAGKILSGKDVDLTKAAVFPYDYAGDTPGQVVIPPYIPWTENASAPVVMAAELTGKDNDGVTHITMGTFRHLMAVIEFTLQDLPAFARGFKLWSATGAQLSGTYGIKATLDGLTWPDPSERTNTQQTICFPYKSAYGASATIKVSVSIPAYAFTDLAIRVIDGDEAVIEGSGQLMPSRYQQLEVGDYVSMPTLNIRSKMGSSRSDYVKVEGIKWAKGNLRAWADGTTGSGWQSGWNVYDNQWESQYALKNDSVSGSSTDFTMNDALYKVDGNYVHWDYFSWATLGRASRVHNQQVTSSEADFNICAKIFSASAGGGDISQMTEVTDQSDGIRFAPNGFGDENPSLYGDVAFWASKGQWRLPSQTEIRRLYAKIDAGTEHSAHMQAGYYMAGSKKINGILFTACPSWEYTTYNKTAVELTDADLESGLFLPKVGERTTNTTPSTYNSANIRYFNAWGVYWCGTYGSRNSGYEDCVRHINFVTSNEMTYGYTSQLSNTITGQSLLGNAIRPVKVE